MHCAAVLVACPLLFCTVKTDGIRQITKPYLGTYRAQALQLGEDNLLPSFQDLKIELTQAGELFVTYKSGAQTQKHTLYFETDDEGKLFVCTQKGARDRREIIYEQGKIVLTFPCGNRTLHAVFGR